MTRAGPLGWSRDLLRPLDVVALLWSATATMPPVAAAYRTLFTTVCRLLVGRRLSIQLDQGKITLTVAALETRPDGAMFPVGQLGEVRLVATDLHWDDSRFDRAEVTLHDVHLRPGVPPVLVAAPVDIALHVPTSILDDLFRWAVPRLSGEIGTDAVARLRWARRPALGSLEVDAQLDGSTLWLKPRGLALRRRRWSVPARIPAYRVQLPDLPHGLRLTGLSFSPGSLQLTGVLPELRMDVPRAGLEDILSQLGSVGRTLNLTTAHRRW